MNQKVDNLTLSLSSIDSHISSLLANIFLCVKVTIIALSCSSIVDLIIVLGSSILYIALYIFQLIVALESSSI
ncbi:MAG: hypothetical protein Q8S84_02865 [bacterium]|nr:hypothetical protein [bacterium]MDP3380476.1 hypothetical protein [bacterium]